MQLNQLLRGFRVGVDLGMEDVTLDWDVLSRPRNNRKRSIVPWFRLGLESYRSSKSG